MRWRRWWSRGCWRGAAADATALAAHVLDVMRRAGRGLQRAGSAVDDPGEAVRLVGELVGNTLGSRLDLLRLLGVVGDAEASRVAR